MEVNVISASVKEREITLADYIAPTAGNVEHDALAITLDGEWDGLDKRVTFYRGEMEYTLPWDGESAITVPWEVLEEPGSFAFTVVGSENGVDRLVTSFMPKHRRVKVSVNGKDEGIQPGEPTLDVIRRIDAVAADLEHKRDSGYFKGEPGAPGQPGQPGRTPEITATKSGKVTTIKADGVSIATVNDGADGAPGEPGDPGKTPVKGVDYFDGEPGKTPVRGTDYWTAADVATIDQHIDQRVGQEYEVMDKAAYDALTSYEVGKLYMVRW